MVAKVDDVEVVQKRLQKDFVINSMLSSVAGNMALCCGRMPADANTTLIIATYIDFEKEPAKEPSKEAHKEPYKVFPLLYTELRNWIHLLKFQNLRKSLQKKPWASQFWQNVTRMKLLGTRGNQKNQKEPEVPAQKKKEPENPSGGVNSYLVLGVEGLAVSRIGRLLSARGHYGHPPVNPSLK